MRLYKFMRLPGDAAIFFRATRKPDSCVTLHWALFKLDARGDGRPVSLVGKFGTLPEVACYLRVGASTVTKLAHRRLAHKRGESLRVRGYQLLKLRTEERIRIPRCNRDCGFA